MGNSTLAADQPQEGLRAIEAARLGRSIGAPALAVYRVLLDHRDPAGENWMLRATLAKRAGLRSPDMAHHALKRLTRFGLLCPGRWRRKKRAGKGGGVTVRTRVVLGDHGHAAGWFQIPSRAFMLALSHKGRGGQTLPITQGKRSPTESNSVMGESESASFGSTLPAEPGPELILPLSAKLAVEGVPPRPAPRLARIPSPPLLPEDDQDAAEWLARLYQDLRRVRGLPRWGWRGPLRRQKWWPALKAGVAALREHDLNPVQWMGWSFAIWGGKGPPPLAWVLSGSRMVERHGWFSAEAEDVAFGGRVMPTPTSTRLMQAWERMANAVYRIGPATPNQVREVAHRHLTPDDAAAMLRAANEEAEQMAREIKADVERGRWVWL